MCLSQLLRVDEVIDDGATARCDRSGRPVEVSLAVLTLGGNTPVAGDWILVSTGMAVERLSTEEAAHIDQARRALLQEENG